MMIGFEFDVCEYGGLGLGRSGEVCLLFGTSCNVGLYGFGQFLCCLYTVLLDEVMRELCRSQV